jgi:hypothetical protein
LVEIASLEKYPLNIGEHVSFLPVGASSGYMPRRGIAGSSGSAALNIHTYVLFLCGLKSSFSLVIT